MQSVKFNGVTKKYESKSVLDNFSVDIELSGITVLMGESGCGKTTFLRLIAGLEKADSGIITGVPETISFMFQEDRLLEWSTAFENVAVVSNTEKAEKYLDAVLLTDDKKTLVNELSGGMKRRVALARALAFESSLVILDEPFKGLDAELKDKIIALIIKESKDRPFIIVEHDENEAEMLGGRIIRFDGNSIKTL